jgi:hypothetical protein
MIKTTKVISGLCSQVSHSNKSNFEQQKLKINLHEILICRLNAYNVKEEILLMKFHQFNRQNQIIL